MTSTPPAAAVPTAAADPGASDAAAPVRGVRGVAAAFGGWVPFSALAGFLVLSLPLARFGIQPLIGLLIGFGIATPLERAFRRHDFPILRKGLRTDVLHFVFTTMLRTLCQGASVGISYLALRHLAFAPTRHWLHALPLPAYFVVAYLGINLAYYLEHRTAHTWGFLWRFHAVHHSPVELDWLAATRLHPVEGFIGGFILAPPLVLVGFGDELAKLAGVFGLFSILDVMVHANVRWRLRPLHRIIGTPEYHHWHHVKAPVQDVNFSLPLFDMLFGTYYMPKDGTRPEIYGIDDATFPDGYLAQLRYPFRRSRGVAVGSGA